MSSPRYAGLEGLYAADPIELAALAFSLVFGRAGLTAPQVEEEVLDNAVRLLAGLPVGSSVFVLLDQPEWRMLQPYVVQTMLIWGDARVAGRRSVGESRRYLILLPRGLDLLRATDPVSTLRALLDPR